MGPQDGRTSAVWLLLVVAVALGVFAFVLLVEGDVNPDVAADRTASASGALDPAVAGAPDRPAAVESREADAERAEQPPTSAEDFLVHGYLLNADNEPLEGAVWASTRPDPAVPHPPYLRGGFEGGQYAFSRLTRGRYRFLLSANWYRSAAATLDFADCGATQRVDFVMKPAVLVNVRLEDENGMRLLDAASEMGVDVASHLSLLVTEQPPDRELEMDFTEGVSESQVLVVGAGVDVTLRASWDAHVRRDVRILASGQPIRSFRLTGRQDSPLRLASGTYTIEIEGEDGAVQSRELVVTGTPLVVPL